jgi:hypothetical protein
MDIKKKYYISPELYSFELDKGIVLLTPTGDPTGFDSFKTEKDLPSGSLKSTPSSTSNPFGGSHPDYGDM